MRLLKIGYVFFLACVMFSCTNNDDILFIMSDKWGGSGGVGEYTWQYLNNNICNYTEEQESDFLATNPIEDYSESYSYHFKSNKEKSLIEDESFIITFDLDMRTYKIYCKQTNEYSDLSGHFDNPQMKTINWDALLLYFSKQ